MSAARRLCASANGAVKPQGGQRASVLECGGKRSATPLWILQTRSTLTRRFHRPSEKIQSAVAAALCRRTPKQGCTSRGFWKALFQFVCGQRELAAIHQEQCS